MSDDPETERSGGRGPGTPSGGLEEATDTLDAIRNGEVDALVVAGAGGRTGVYAGRGGPSLPGADRSHAARGGDPERRRHDPVLQPLLRRDAEDAPEKVSGRPASRFVPPADQARTGRPAPPGPGVPQPRGIRSWPRTARCCRSIWPCAPCRCRRRRRLGLIVTDLTEQKQQEELVAAHRRKDDFLAILAHELRNPLAPIRTALHLLRTPGAAGGTADQAQDMIGARSGT